MRSLGNRFATFCDNFRYSCRLQLTSVDGCFWDFFSFLCTVTVTDGLSPSKCDCPVECEKVKYSTILSAAYFPSAHFWNSIYELLNISVNDTKSTKTRLQEAIRKRLLKVNIFYESLSTEVTEKKPAYDLNDFGSDIGGNMGLFLGCSLLTLCEFFDLLLLVLVNCWGKKHDSSQTIESTDTHIWDERVLKAIALCLVFTDCSRVYKDLLVKWKQRLWILSRDNLN